MAIAPLELWRRPEKLFEELLMKEKNKTNPNDPLAI